MPKELTVLNAFISPETFIANNVVVDTDVVVVVVDVVVEVEMVVVVPIVVPDAASMSLIHTTLLQITCVVGWSWPWGWKARKRKLKRGKRYHKL